MWDVSSWLYCDAHRGVSGIQHRPPVQVIYGVRQVMSGAGRDGQSDLEVAKAALDVQCAWEEVTVVLRAAFNGSLSDTINSTSLTQVECSVPNTALTSPCRADLERNKTHTADAR